jgi:hypothetical protein
MSGDMESLRAARIEITEQFLTEIVMRPVRIFRPYKNCSHRMTILSWQDGSIVSFYEAVIESQSPAVIMGLASYWSTAKEVEMDTNEHGMRYVKAVVTLFGLEQAAEARKLIARSTAPLSPYEAAFVSLIRQFSSEFWHYLLKVDPWQRWIRIKQIVSPPLSLDPAAPLSNGLPPCCLCSYGEQIRDFHELGVDLRPIWPLLSSPVYYVGGSLVTELLNICMPSLTEALHLLRTSSYPTNRAVRTILSKGDVIPTAEQFEIAVSQRQCDVVELFTYMGVGRHDRLFPSFPKYALRTSRRGQIISSVLLTFIIHLRLPDQLVGVSFYGRNCGQKNQLQLSFNSAGTHTATFSVHIPAVYSVNEVSWGSVWSIIKPKSTLIPEIIQCEITAEAAADPNVGNFLPAGAFYFLPVFTCEQPNQLILIEIRPRGSPAEATWIDLMPGVLRDDSLFRIIARNPLQR